LLELRSLQLPRSGLLGEVPLRVLRRHLLLHHGRHLLLGVRLGLWGERRRRGRPALRSLGRRILGRLLGSLRRSEARLRSSVPLGRLLLPEARLLRSLLLELGLLELGLLRGLLELLGRVRGRLVHGCGGLLGLYRLLGLRAWGDGGTCVGSGILLVPLLETNEHEFGALLMRERMPRQHLLTAGEPPEVVRQRSESVRGLFHQHLCIARCRLNGERRE
jgi:hypothetical protein